MIGASLFVSANTPFRLNRINRTQFINDTVQIFAFFCWNIDNIFCYEISKLKAQIWSPLSFFFELHAIWHLLVGLGVFYVIASVEYATLSVRDKPENYESEPFHFVDSSQLEI